MMQKCLPLLALVALGAEAQFPTQCVLDVGLGAFGLLNAGLGMNSAVAQCGADGEQAQCVADIGKVVSGLGTTSGRLSQAVGSCGGEENECASDISYAVANIGAALTSAGQAGVSCGGSTESLCISDVLAAGSSLALAVNDMQNAEGSCGKSALALPAPATACGRALATLRRDVATAMPPHNIVTPLISAHVNATAAACGGCFGGRQTTFNTAVAQKQWYSALVTVVQAGAQC